MFQELFFLNSRLPNFVVSDTLFLLKVYRDSFHHDEKFLNISALIRQAHVGVAFLQTFSNKNIFLPFSSKEIWSTEYAYESQVIT